jgi:hypothetical protein
MDFPAKQFREGAAQMRRSQGLLLSFPTSATIAVGRAQFILTCVRAAVVDALCDSRR